MNEARERNGLRRLRFNMALRRAATSHSEDMVRSGKFSHYGSGGSTLATRIARTGYLANARSYAIGENIAWGAGRRLGCPAGIVRAWMHSAGHRASILNPAYRDFGVGVIHGSPSSGGQKAATYTLNFGMRR